jgi:IS5 family transposase
MKQTTFASAAWEKKGKITRRLLLKSGTIVDATIIDAPPSTKSEAKARDPEMKQGKKNGREWHFGMKAHVGTDLNGLVHTLVTTHAGASDFSQLPHLLHGAERELYGDQAYWKRLWGFSKVRYRGLAKNTARLFTAFALASLYMVRRQLMPMREACRC